jgi:hypothetical protein
MKYDPLNDLIHAIPTSRLLLQKAHEEGALIERLCLYVSTIDALLRLALVYSRTQKAPNYTYTIPKETRGASAPIPSHLAIEPARFALRHGQRNAVGCGSRSEAKTLSPAREARDRALRVPCFSSRERDRDGRRGCSDGDSTESPRSLRCAHDDEIYTRDLRGRPQDRGSIRRTAYMLAHRGDHAGGKRIILVLNGAKFEWWRRRVSD